MRTPSLFLAIALAGLLPPTLVASEQRSVREAVSSGRYKPLAEILQIAEQLVPGRVLEVELEVDRLHGAVYEIELLDAHNRKRELRIHAETGVPLQSDEPLPPSAQPLMPLPQLLRQVLQQHPGHVEDAELEFSASQGPVYELKLVQHNGQRLELVVDARSGEVLRGAPSVEDAMRGMLPLPDILDGLLQRYPGAVLEAELERERQRNDQAWYYDIEIRLDAGGSVELHVDTHTAQVLREKHKD